MQKSTYLILAAMALALVLVAGATVQTAQARIECTNNGGQTPNGQQGKDRCNNNAMENLNPSGKPPGGWN